MSKLLRHSKIGNLYFITCVTDHRRLILVDNYSFLQTALQRTIKKYNISLPGFVVMPEHIHALVDINHHSISDIMHTIKLSFSYQYRRHNKNVPGQVWQKRFWDHMIRDQEDFNRHLDYIHYNPVKHGYVKHPFDWRYSSISQYRDFYSDDWGVREDLDFSGEFGE